MAVQPLPVGRNDYVNPYADLPSWWSFFFEGGYSWRWGQSPHLYFRPNLAYTKGTSFAVIDGFGREKVFDQAFECYMDPFTGKIEKLYVQAPASICRLGATSPNGTWKRTPVRNVSPMSLRIANLPFRFIPAERRHDVSKYTGNDWAIVVGMWIPTALCFLLSTFTWSSGTTVEGKDVDKYLPLLYGELKYSRLARNLLENRQFVARQLYKNPAWTPSALGTYRTFRPRFLNYLVEDQSSGKKRYKLQRRLVPVGDLTPYVVVAYSSAHFDAEHDVEVLLGLATQAAVSHFNPMPTNLEANPRAFWLAENCMPNLEVADDAGNIRYLDISQEQDRQEQVALANQDTYSICDIVRNAKHVVIIVGNPRRPWDNDALRVWGQRVWTLPEVVLSRGDSVTVQHWGIKPGQESTSREIREIPKALFPTQAWNDPFISRQLIEHYSNLHLSRLELVKVALDCLMSRRFRSMHPGDRVYVLMSLLRIRPPIDKTDSSFQAFARLSLPQDSDRLMERLICLLPDTPEQNWELMSDQYKASLWDIYPDTQVCAIGENDTVIVDGAKGAQIQWSTFSQVQSLRRLTNKRWLFLKIVEWSPLIFMIGVIMAGTTAPRPAPSYDGGGYSTYGYVKRAYLYSPAPAVYNAGVAILVISLLFFVLPAPYFIWQLYAGKLWQIEPCFFGIEGYVPIEAIEERLFGLHCNRMRWSAWGSPLSRHRQGTAVRERTVQYRHDEYDENTPLVSQPRVAGIDTYPVETIDPCSSCAECAGNGGQYCQYHPTPRQCQDMSRSPMGQMKVFTLIDTFNMTVTLFYAVRPPTVLLIGGSEGGMKRAIACSFDMTTGTLYRETVLRIPTQSVDRMESLPRIRLGLRRPFLESDVFCTKSAVTGYQTNLQPPTTSSGTVLQQQSIPQTSQIANERVIVRSKAWEGP